jgi:hypothetical protein
MKTKNKILLSTITALTLGAISASAVCSAAIDFTNKELSKMKLATDMNASDNKITNLKAPTDNTDAVTKKYADDAIELASYGYGTIQYNNLTWLDRNLGATRIPSSATDTSAGTTGYLIQWGRELDGHQHRTLSNGTNGSDEDASVDYKTNTLATSAQPGHSKFITINADPENWLATPDANLWQGTNGVNNPCPAGYRLPTKDDFNVDNFNNSADIYAALKLNYAGRRYNLNGSIAFVGEKAFYWSSTVDGEKTYVLYFRSNDEFFTYPTLRANGLSVRCVK